MASAKKCRYCGEWIDSSDAEDEGIVVQETSKAEDKPNGCGKHEPAAAEDKVPSEEEKLETSLGFSISKKLTKRITCVLTAIAVCVFGWLGYMIFSDSQKSITMSNMDGSWKELGDSDVNKYYQFKKDGTFNEITETTQPDESGLTYSVLVSGKWDYTNKDILGQVITMDYDLNELHVQGHSEDGLFDEDDPRVMAYKQVFQEKYEEENKATKEAENQGKAYGLSRLTLRNDTLFQNWQPIAVKIADIAR